MATALPDLIDKLDNFEVVRDQLAALLLVNTTNQQALATAASKDPNLWKFDVYTERANPWEKWLNVDGSTPDADLTPITNVWFENASYDEGKSNVVDRQLAEATFNIDIYAFGKNASDGGSGQIVADQDAALNAQRVARLCRNIFMAAENTYLQARGLVWQRWTQALTSFQPTLDGRPVQRVLAMRLAMRVRFNELSPQVPEETLELIAFQLKREEDGSVYFDANYDYTI